MRPDAAAFLWDVRSAAERISTFTAGLTEQTYAADDLRRSAVERQLEIVGEALNRLRREDPETASMIPDIARIVGLRNVLAHGYAVVDHSVVWNAATVRVPELRRVVVRLLDQA